MKKTSLLGQTPTQELGRVKVSEIQLSQKKKGGIFYNLRQTFKKKSMASLKVSIAEIGLEAPILVRAIRNNPKSEFDQDKFPKNKLWELIAGERRIRAIMKLIEENADCVDPSTGNMSIATKAFEYVDAKILYNCSDEWALRLSVSENLEREQVSQLDLMNFCIELSEVRNSMGGIKWTPSQVAEIMGKSETWVSHTKSLMKLPNEVKKLLANNIIDRSIALYFLKVDPEKISEVVEKVKEMSLAQQDLDKSLAEKFYNEAQKKCEIAEAGIVTAKYGFGDIGNARKERTLAKQKMRESKKRRNAANEKKPKITQDIVQEAAVKAGAVKKKKNPISVKTIRQKRDVLKKAVEESNSQKIIDPETGDEYSRRDIEIVLSVCEHILGKTGTFNPFAIIKGK